MKKLLMSMISLVLMVAILAPSFTRLSHALYEHQEPLCLDTSSVHVHEIELDCDFQKFKLSPQHYPTFAKVKKRIVSFIKVKNFNHYTFLSKYQKLHFALRGPPVS